MHSSLQNIRLANIPVLSLILMAWTIQNLIAVNIKDGDRHRQRYLPTDNGKLFWTGNHPIETLLPLYHLHAAGFEFEVATISGLMTVKIWAMPHKDEKVMPFFEQHKSLFRNPEETRGCCRQPQR